MENESSKLLHADLTEKIIGVYYDVYNEIGHGFLESVYNNSMHRTLTQAGLSAEREVAIPVFFRGWDVGQFKADLVVNRLILVELKAAHSLDRSHEAQVMTTCGQPTLKSVCSSTSAPRNRNSAESSLKMQIRKSAFIRVNPR